MKFSKIKMTNKTNNKYKIIKSKQIKYTHNKKARI